MNEWMNEWASPLLSYFFTEQFLRLSTSSLSYFFPEQLLVWATSSLTRASSSVASPTQFLPLRSQCSAFSNLQLQYRRAQE